MENVLKLVKYLKKAYSDLLVSVVLVGSYAEGGVGGDIDLLAIYDNLSLVEKGLNGVEFESEFLELVDELAKRSGLGGVKRMGEMSQGEMVDLFLVSMSEFWSLLEGRSPHVLSYLEHGVALVDEGFFKYLQRLFRLGVFKPDERAAWELFERASKRAVQAGAVKLLLVAEDCYNAIVGSAMALLMKLGVRVSPSNVYEELVKNFVDTGMLEGEMAEWVRKIIELRKGVERGGIKELSGEEVDIWIRRADAFTSKAYQLLTRTSKR